ncbi:MAG TPA: choice-of-anchor D domain-containing protein [Solirubrobacterales bacterium]
MSARAALVFSLAVLALPMPWVTEPAEAAPPPGDEEVPSLTFQPGDYDFGIQRVNGGYETSFQLANTGAAPVQFNGFEIAGPDSNVFWTGSSNCWGQWLEPGQSCTVQVGFNPRDTVSYAATLRANVNGASFTAGLVGRGGRAVVEAASNPFDLGAATVGSDGGLATVTMTNSGDLPALFFIAVIAGGDAGSFRLLDEDCSAEPLQPGASCSVHVRFLPQRPGPLAARLAFFGDGDNGTMVVLRGEGLEPQLSIGPDHDFGRQRVDSRGAPHTFAVRNAGSAPVDLGAVSLGGRDPDQFVVSGDSCAGVTLAAGESCTVAVRFGPDSRGNKSALLRVGGGSATLTASLSGTGLDEGGSARARRAFVRRTGLNAARARCNGVKRCQPHLRLSRATRVAGR